MPFLERRQEQRFRTRLPCKLESTLGECSSALITKISGLGLQLGGNRELIKLVFPHFKRDNWRDPIDIKIHFAVSTTDAV